MIPVHPAFKLNGTHFQNVDELKSFAENLVLDSNSYKKEIGYFLLNWLDNHEFIIVNTSGSTGKPKEIQLKKEQVKNSALATGNYFETFANATALLCLSADYIAGKMMLVRAMVLGWDLYCVAPDKEPLKNIQKKFDFAAMVPYQVSHSLKDLHKVKKLIVGGGVVSKTLEERLQKLKTACFATYGMTETISHIAVRPVNGENKSTIYSALPTVQFSKNEYDCLIISAPGISEETVNTNDVVDLISSTSFQFLGRIDNVINSGGIKIHPESLEEELSKSIKIPFIVTSEKDELLGERVILIIESEAIDDVPNLKKSLENLPKHHQPKKIYALANFPRTETGKIIREAVKNML